MRHSQKTAQLNYNKVFTAGEREDDCRDTKKSLVEKEIELQNLLLKLEAYEQSKPDIKNYRKRRRDILYHLNNKGTLPRESTLKKYDIKYTNEKYI